MATRGGGGAKSSRKTAGKNPYADGGRDEFAALMAEVEEKKRAVHSKLGPGEAVRFVCGGGGELEAVVVRPDKKVCRYKKIRAAMVDGEGGHDSGRQAESDGGEVVPVTMFLLGGVVVLVVLGVGLVGRCLKAYWLMKLRAAIC